MYLQNKYTKWYNSIISKAKSRISFDTYYEIHHIIPKSMKGDDSIENLVKLTAKEHFICHLLLTKMTIGIDRRNMNFAFWSLCNKRKNSKDTDAYNYYVNSRFYQTAKEDFSKENSKTHKGKTLSQETKNKISKSHSGKKLSNEHKQKISDGSLHKSHTDEMKRYLSVKQKEDYASGNRIHGMLGKTHTNETKDKISVSNKGKIMPPLTQERKDKISIQFTGTIQSDNHISRRISSRQKNGYYKDEISTKEKMSKSAKNRYKIKCHCGKECSSLNYKRWHGENCKLPT